MAIDWKKKIGPLPVWSYAAVGTGALGYVLWRRHKLAAAAAAGTTGTASSGTSDITTPGTPSYGYGSGAYGYDYGAGAAQLPDTTPTGTTTPTLPAPLPNGSVTYLAQAGDTLSTIVGRLAGVVPKGQGGNFINELKGANPGLGATTALTPGQVINVPKFYVPASHPPMKAPVTKPATRTLNRAA